MQRTRIFLFVLLLSLLLLAGCGADEEHTEPPATNPSPDVSTETEYDSFHAYKLTVTNPKLEIYSGPGYNYEIVDYISDQGDYVIIDHKYEILANGKQTTWGKLQNEQGWINLDEATEDTAADDPEDEVTEETVEEEFVPYTITIKNQRLSVYSGPGYAYNGVEEIIGGGTYTIVEESIENFSGGRYVIWGKLKSGAGWICLDDANLTPETPPPYRCTECGRADVSISRYGLCDACHKKVDIYGYCEVCFTPLTAEDKELQDGTRCRSCCACDFCGVDMTVGSYYYIDESETRILYCCYDCIEVVYRCSYCGLGTYPDVTTDGLCSDCYNDLHYCSDCGVWLDEGNTAYNGYGKCEDCYYEALDPEYICDNCGADCSFSGVYDGLCIVCYENSHNNYCWWCGAACDGELCSDCDRLFCDWCGDPIMEGHNCR